MSNKLTDQEERGLRFLAETGMTQYTKTSNQLIEALMKPGHPVWLRVLFCLIRMSWGHDSPYATVDFKSKKPARQTDLKRILSISKQRVSEEIADLAKRGYVETREDRIYLIPNPSLRKGITDGQGDAAHERALQRAPELFEHRLTLLKEMNRIKKELNQVNKKIKIVTAEERELLKDTALPTPELGPGCNGPITPKARPVPPGRIVPPAADDLRTHPYTKTQIDKISSSAVLEILTQYGAADREAADRIIKECREQSPDATIPEIIHFIHEKGPVARRAENSIGALISYVPKCFPEALEIWRRHQSKHSQNVERLPAQEREDDIRNLVSLIEVHQQQDDEFSKTLEEYKISHPDDVDRIRRELLAELGRS